MPASRLILQGIGFAFLLASSGAIAAPKAPKTQPKTHKTHSKLPFIALPPRAPKVPAPPKIDPVPGWIGLAYDSIEARKPERALEHLSRVRGRASGKKFRDHDLFLTAEAHRMLGEKEIAESDKGKGALSRVDRAYSAYLELYSNFPSSPLLDHLTDRMARIDFFRGKLRSSNTDTERGFARVFQLRYPVNHIPFDTLDHYVGACVKFPNPVCTGWLRKSVEGLPKRAPERALLEKALPSAFLDKDPTENYERLTQTYREEIVSDVADFDEVMALVLRGEDREALDRLDEFLKEYPKSGQRVRANYWRGALLSKRGKKEEAEKSWKAVIDESPFSYYALLSNWQRGTDPVESLAKAIDDPLPSRGTWLKPTEWARIDRAEEFLRSGARAPAAEELSDLSPRREMPSSFLVYLAWLQNRAGNHRQAFSLVSEIFQRGDTGIANLRTFEWLFPRTRFESLIFDEAKEQGVDPVLALSLIKQESGFDNEAMSQVGASGLMQLMPYTALDADPTVLQNELTRPSLNVRVGMRYLSIVLKRFKGNAVAALAGYNSGPTRADRWLKEANPRWGVAEFIESIPYRETREYVGSIIRNHWWYSARLDKETPNSLDRYWSMLKPLETPVPRAAKPSSR